MYDGALPPLDRDRTWDFDSILGAVRVPVHRDVSGLRWREEKAKGANVDRVWESWVSAIRAAA